MMSTEQDFKRNLASLVVDVRTETKNWWIADIARSSGLSWGTCKRFVSGETKSPYYKTVFRLARCIGVDIKFRQTPKTQRLRVVHKKAS